MRRSIALSLLLAAPAVLVAQDTTSRARTPGSYTRMLIGAGGMATVSPLTFLVGVEHKKKDSKLGLRVMGEISEDGPYVGGMGYRHATTYGLQILGIRPFREGHRFEPYVFAGVGIYQQQGMFQRWNYDEATNTFSAGEFVSSRKTAPELLWGAGTTMRLKGLTFFGDVKFPNWADHGIGYGRAAPLKFGIRF